MKKQCFTVLLATSFLVGGCAPVIVGGMATAGYLAAQERGAKQAVVDTKIKAHIKDKLTSENYRFLTKVEVTVMQNNVLLTGVVDSSADAATVERIVKATPDVKNVYNHLFTDGIYPSDTYGKDSWLGTQVRARLLSAKDVYSINYHVHVVNGYVFVIGLATTKGELERVLHIVRTTKGVEKVYNYIDIYKEPKAGGEMGETDYYSVPE